MRFSELAPEVCSTSPWLSPTDPVWQLSFECPRCRHRTSINVAGEQASSRVIWKIEPTPPALFGALDASKDINEQVKANWDRVTIEPSMQNLPHPRQVSCNAHFTVTHGEVTNH